MAGVLDSADGTAVHPLCLGGNVFGWAADERGSFTLLDAFAEAGGNFVDTPDEYASWLAHGTGVSERILGSWMASRGNRERIVVATKVGRTANLDGLSAAVIAKAVDDSLVRLGTDYIDLLYAYRDDADTPLEETLAAFDELVGAGKVRRIGASDYTAERFAEALAVSAREGFEAFAALQPDYNLIDREYEDELLGLCAAEGIACVPAFGQATGFLSREQPPDTVDARGRATLAVLGEVAAAHGAPFGAIALAWLRGRPTVAAAVVSVRTVEQLGEILPMAMLELDDAEIARLDAVAGRVVGNG